MTDATKILWTQILAVILTPVSVALTLYLVQRSRAPRPDIQYVKALPGYIVIEPLSSFATQIDDDPGLYSAFTNQIGQYRASNDNSPTCIGWLNGDTWDNDCMAVYKGVVNLVTGDVKGVAEQGLGTIQEARAKNSLKILDAFRKELARAANAKQPRAGSVTLNVGVLNAGDSDGTIFQDGLLKFKNLVLHVSADHYTPIGPLGFSEVSFTTAREDSGQFYGDYKKGEESTIKVWSDLVKTGNEIPFELTITLSGKKEAIKSTVPKED